MDFSTSRDQIISGKIYTFTENYDQTNLDELLCLAISLNRVDFIDYLLSRSKQDSLESRDSLEMSFRLAAKLKNYQLCKKILPRGYCLRRQ